jgi:hypothetical protein
MILTERSDFRAWLGTVQAAHDALQRGGFAPRIDRPDCRRCGDQLNDFTSCGYCLLCLAEQFGAEQAEEAAVVGQSVLVSLLSARGVHRDTLHATVERVIDECWRMWEQHP